MEKEYNIIIGDSAGANIIKANNCLLLGFNAGADLTEADGVRIIGDDIRNLDKGKDDVIYIGEKMIVGKTVLGKPCNLYDILKGLV